MANKMVSIVKYERPLESVSKAIDICNGLKHLPSQAKVFIKPNIVWWTTKAVFPKWGVITTSRVVEDMVTILKAHGIDDITIGEGMVINPKDTHTAAMAFEGLGYKRLEKRYGVKCLNVHERPFEQLDLGLGSVLNFSKDALDSDFLVDIPVLKTHNQTIVSLGIKNLKGLLDIESRKACHTSDPINSLHRCISKFIQNIPPSLTLIDGIFSNEIGPSFAGRIKRTNLLIASSDMLSADMVGARVLGYDPSLVPHLALAAADRHRPVDLSDVDLVGEDIEKTVAPHAYAIPYNEEKKLPAGLADMGITGIALGDMDLSICTYCASYYPTLFRYLALSWKGEPWDDVEVLVGKDQQPTPGKKKTILFGNCIYQAHKNNPDIKEMIPIKGCPPRSDGISKAFEQAGIPLTPLFGNLQATFDLFMAPYKDNPEFDLSFHTIQE